MKVVRVANRVRAPAITGYRDLKLNVEYEGHVCELQLHLQVSHLRTLPRIRLHLARSPPRTTKSFVGMFIIASELASEVSGLNFDAFEPHLKP